MALNVDIPRRKRIKTTSREAYERIKENGQLSKMRMKTYKLLRYYGPLTGQEVDAKGSGTQQQSLHKRLSELETLGLAEVVGTRRCRVTGHNADEWDITDHYPDSFVLEKKATRAELVGLLREAQDLLGDGSPPLFVQELKKRIKDVLGREE